MGEKEKELRKDIIKLLIESESPLRTEEIAEKINGVVNAVRPEVGWLLENKFLQEFRIDTDKWYRRYYISPEKKEDLKKEFDIDDELYKKIQQKSISLSTQDAGASAASAKEYSDKSSVIFDEVND